MVSNPLIFIRDAKIKNRQFVKLNHVKEKLLAGSLISIRILIIFKMQEKRSLLFSKWITTPSTTAEKMEIFITDKIVYQ
jgi:hypothetical protein